MIRIVFALLAIAGGLTVAVAQDPVAARRQVMKDFSKHHYGVLLPVSNGKAPYDQAKVDAAFVAMAEIAKQGLPNAFPAGSDKGPSDGSDYYLKAGSLAARADIDAKVAAMAKSIADNRAKTKDADSAKAAYTAINNTCNACHNDYRQRKG